MKAIILAGGSGDRLWPLSRRNFPKQFLQQNNRNSLFQDTIIRNIPFCDEIIVVTNLFYREIVEGQMQRFQGVPYQLILEEDAKGTAPAIAVASQILGMDEELLILPADLLMEGDGYSDSIYRAKELSEKGKLVLFGTRAEEPIESYGYIRYRGSEVTRYIEKPSRSLAERIFADDDILWNSGLLLCRNATLRQEMERYAGRLYTWAEQMAKMMMHDDCMGTEVHADGKRSYILSKKQLASLERTHIEKVLLENSDNMAVVKLQCTWRDISNFDAYVHSALLEKERDTIQLACNNTSVINTANRQLVVANGLEDILVVNTEDAIYISRKDVEQDIKGIIAGGTGEYEEFFQYNPKTYRSWGTREIISQAPGYRVRKLELYPGATLSAHRHEHRNENYSIIKGRMSLDIDGSVVEIAAGESINVLPGQMHRLYNDTDKLIVAIEVDTGAEIDERDMVHLDELEKTGQQKMPQLYRLLPAYKDYLWGGRRLVSQFGKQSPYEITAESWELSAHKDGQSVISGGPFDGRPFGDFITEYGVQVCGWKSKTFDRFPILIKFIDACNPLSVQIHPYDDYALVHEKEFGKNEMWYIMDARPGAFLYCGFAREVTPDEVRRRLADNTITEVLNKVPVHKGDVVFIPAGTIHAIGAGILICEIQQNSNSTYRVYDYDRVDKNGNRRELHVDKAMEVMTFSAYEQGAFGLMEPRMEGDNRVQQLCLCKYFKCDKYEVEKSQLLYVDDAAFVSLVFLAGEAVVSTEEEQIEVKAGDSIFVAAGRKAVHIDGKCEFIATTI